MAHGEAGDDLEAESSGPPEHMFTPETDKLIRDIGTMSDRWSVNPFMFEQPFAGTRRRQKPKLFRVLGALRERAARRRLTR